jgi:hypothetical protein
VTYLIEYLGEFDFIFETLLGYVSGDQMGSFEAKKTESKISCLGTFKFQQIRELECVWCRRPQNFKGPRKLMGELKMF